MKPNLNDNLILIACFRIAGINRTNIFSENTIQCKATKYNAKKLDKIAEAVKYSGKHLTIHLLPGRNYLTCWLENNTSDLCEKEYTLLGFEHDLLSLA